MLKFYILVSSPTGLLRHFSPHYSGLTSDNAEIIINTLDKDAERDLKYICELFDFRYHITESNGTPARGKNSLLEIFEKSDNDYCVQIDGDDYLTPHGVWFYQTVAAGSSVPDVICLKNQISWCRTGKMWSEEVKKELRRFFTIEKDSIDYDELLESMVKQHIPEEKAKVYVEYHRDYYSTQEKYCEAEEAHSRVVFMSKKAAKYRFPEELVVGEDTVFYYLLKDAHFRGELTAVCNDEAPATYVYNQLEGGGTVWNHSKGFTDWSWMGKFNEIVKGLEKSGILHEPDLPLIKIQYDETSVLDDLDTAGLLRYERGEEYVDLPANATRSTINHYLKNHSTPLEK